MQGQMPTGPTASSPLLLPEELFNSRASVSDPVLITWEFLTNKSNFGEASRSVHAAPARPHSSPSVGSLVTCSQAWRRQPRRPCPLPLPVSVPQEPVAEELKSVAGPTTLERLCLFGECDGVPGQGRGWSTRLLTHLGSATRHLPWTHDRGAWRPPTASRRRGWPLPRAAPPGF